MDRAHDIPVGGGLLHKHQHGKILSRFAIHVQRHSRGLYYPERKVLFFANTLPVSPRGMSLDKVRETIAAGSPALGVWVTLGDPLSAEIIGRAGYDCVCLDAQHGGITFENLLSVMQALDLGGTRALVRVPWCDQAQIMRALDLGALGVIVPMVSTPEQARLAAQASHYPPNGVRSFGQVRNYYGAQPTSFKPLCLVMIETAQAMENLDAIAGTPGVDGLFVGPVDLGLSLGLGVVLGSNNIIFDAIDKVVAACQRHDKICGSATLGLPYARSLAERGVRLLMQGNDVGFIRRAAATEVEQMRSWGNAKSI